MVRVLTHQSSLPLGGASHAPPTRPCWGLIPHMMTSLYLVKTIKLIGQVWVESIALDCPLACEKVFLLSAQLCALWRNHAATLWLCISWRNAATLTVFPKETADQNSGAQIHKTGKMASSPVDT